jgi:hypothetical protein
LCRIGTIRLVAKSEPWQVHGEDAEARGETVQYESPAEERLSVSVEEEQSGIAGARPKRTKPEASSVDILCLVDRTSPVGLNPGDPRRKGDEHHRDPSLCPA